MKIAIVPLLSLLLMVTDAGAQTLCGDPDGSGTNTVSDGVIVLREAAGLSTECTGRICDIDGNGTVTVSDGVATLRMVARLPTPISCGTRFGELVKTVAINGVAADLLLGPPPSSAGGAAQDVVAIEGASEVRSGEIARFLVTLARSVEALIVAFKENGSFVDGFARVEAGSVGTSVDLDLTIGEVPEDVVSDLQIAGSVSGEVGAFRTRPVTIVGGCAIGGGALAFDGVDDLVTFGSVASLAQHTVEAWVRPAANGGNVVAQNTSSGPACTEGILLATNDEGIFCYALDPAGCGTSNAVCAGPASNGRWTHVAGTYDGTLGRLYVNGDLMGTLTNVSFPSTSFLRAGTYFFFSGGQDYFGGDLDELRIWDHARSAEEIRATMKAPVTADAAGLRGYWQFDEVDGQQVFDNSPTGRTGTLGTGGLEASDDPVRIPSTICEP